MSLGPAPGADTADIRSGTGARGVMERGVVESKGAEHWLRRMRLERQLHDGASLRISALSLRLGLLRCQGSASHAAAAADAAGTAASFQASIDELQDELHAVLEELRDVAGQIYPPLLDQGGLTPALRELADQAGIEVTVVADGERFGPAAEGAAYFAVADCLAAGTPTAPVRVTADRDGELLVLSLTGVDSRHAELVEDHARPLGGSVNVTDVMEQSGGRTITMRLPCE